MSHDADLKRRDELALEAETLRQQAITAAKKVQAYDAYLIASGQATAAPEAVTAPVPAIVTVAPATPTPAPVVDAPATPKTGRKPAAPKATKAPKSSGGAAPKKTKGPVARDQAFQQRAQRNRAAVASGERPALKQAMVAIMGPTKAWKAEDILAALRSCGLAPDGDKPLNYLRSTLASHRKFFEHTDPYERGVYKATAEAYGELSPDLIKLIKAKKAEAKLKPPTAQSTPAAAPTPHAKPAPKAAAQDVEVKPAPKTAPASNGTDVGAAIMRALDIPDVQTAPSFS